MIAPPRHGRVSCPSAALPRGTATGEEAPGERERAGDAIDERQRRVVERDLVGGGFTRQGDQRDGAKADGNGVDGPQHRSDAGDRRSELRRPSGPRKKWRPPGGIVCEALSPPGLEGARTNPGAGATRVPPAFEGATIASVTGVLSGPTTLWAQPAGRAARATQPSRRQGLVARSAGRFATRPARFSRADSARWRSRGRGER